MTTNQKIFIESESTLCLASTNQLDKFIFHSHDLMSSKLFYIKSIVLYERKCQENIHDINVNYLAEYQSNKHYIKYYCLFNYKNGIYKPVYDEYPIRNVDMFVYTAKKPE